MCIEEGEDGESEQDIFCDHRGTFADCGKLLSLKLHDDLPDGKLNACLPSASLLRACGLGVGTLMGDKWAIAVDW